MIPCCLSEPTKETFTGKERDAETGRYYFGARYYDAALGRWSVTDPAGQFASPYVYANNPLSYTDPDGEFVGLVLATAAIASTINGIQASRAGAHWTDVISSVTGSFTQTAVIGGFSAGTPVVLSSASASAAPASAGGTVGGQTAASQAGVTIATNAATNAAYSALSRRSGDEILRSAFVGAVTAGAGVASLSNIESKSLLYKLGAQAFNTSLSSIGDNFATAKPLLSSVDIGVGPVNLTLREGRAKYLFRKNAGNVAVHGLGLLNYGVDKLLYGKGSDANVNFYWSDLAFESTGGIAGKIYNKLPVDWTGLHAVAGINNPTERLIRHEITHVWQSRFFNHNYLPNWLLGGLNSVYNGYHFNSVYGNGTLNYFELNALENE